MRKSIVVVGAGSAGLTAAHCLGRAYDVTLVERDTRLGGHAHTLTFDHGEDASVVADIGFMMLNDRTYPQMMRLLDSLGGMELAETSVSFSYCTADGETSIGFGDPGKPHDAALSHDREYLRLLVDIVKFGRRAHADLARLDELTMSLGDYLALRAVRREVIDQYVVPSTAAIWSTSPEKVLSDFPAATYLKFMNHHGMLSRTDPPRWLIIRGGSQRYVAAIERAFGGRIVKGQSVTHVAPSPRGIDVCFGEERMTFDAAVLACPADEALRVLDERFSTERHALEGFAYQRNDVVVHTDPSCLPAKRSLWGAWNFRKERQPGRYTMTYYLNRLQQLGPTKHEYFVTLNDGGVIASERVLYRTVMSHPVLSRRSEAAQRQMRAHNGKSGLWFCGNYMGFGFHEDAIASALAVAEGLGAPASW